MKNSGIALVAVILLLVAGLSFYAGQNAGSSNKPATETTFSVLTQTTTSRLTSTVTLSPSLPPVTSTTTTITSSTTNTITSTLTSTETVTTSSSTNFTGLSRSIPAFANLQLTLSLNTTSLASGRGVKINIAMANTLPDPNDVKSANRWPLVGLVAGACGTFIYPMGLEIIRGTNLSAASSSYLALFVGPQSCPNGAGTPIPQWLFKADSQWALPVPFPAYYPMNATLQVGGYWTWNGIDPRTEVHHAFEPGIYTVVVGDAWGDLVLLQFTVT